MEGANECAQLRRAQEMVGWRVVSRFPCLDGICCGSSRGFRATFMMSSVPNLSSVSSGAFVDSVDDRLTCLWLELRTWNLYRSIDDENKLHFEERELW